VNTARRGFATAASVQAPALAFEPEVVDVSEGGTVTWTIGAITYDVVFITPNAPENIQPTENTSAFRVFPTNGVFFYHCLIHQGMNGSVRVH
jgi:plastocyanin